MTESPQEPEATTLRGRLAARFGRYAMIDRLHLGRHREIVVPALFLAVVSAIGAAVFWAISRVRRAKARRNLVALPSGAPKSA